MNEYEALLLKHGQPLLGPGEKFEGMARVAAQVNLWRMRHFVAGASAKRLVLVELPSGVIGSRPEFVGVRDFPYREIESLFTTGFLNARSIHIDLRSGESTRLQLNSLRRYVPGQSSFVKVLRSQYEHFKLKPEDEQELPEAPGASTAVEEVSTEGKKPSPARLGVAVLAGAIAALLAALVWAAITLATGYQIGWMAIGVGVVVGAVVGFVGRGRTRSFGAIGAVFAVLGTLLGNVLWVAYAASTVVETSLPGILLALISRPDLLVDLMIASFDLSDLTFYILAAFFGYALAVSPLGPRRKLEAFPKG